MRVEKGASLIKSLIPIMFCPILGAIFGHVGDGNFHTLLLYDPKNEKEYSVLKNIAIRCDHQ